MLMNANRLFEKMGRGGLDAVVATMPENVTYTSGFWAMSHWIRRGPQAYVLTPKREAGEPAIITSTGIIDLAVEEDVWVKDVRRYGAFFFDRLADVQLDGQDRRIQELVDGVQDADAVSALVRAVKDRKLERARIGIDEIGIVPQNWDRLADELPEAALVRAADVFRYARAIKTREEVARLRRSAQIADLSITAALDVATDGMTENELARVFTIRRSTRAARRCLDALAAGRVAR